MISREVLLVLSVVLLVGGMLMMFPSLRGAQILMGIGFFVIVVGLVSKGIVSRDDIDGRGADLWSWFSVFALFALVVSGIIALTGGFTVPGTEVFAGREVIIYSGIILLIGETIWFATSKGKK